MPLLISAAAGLAVFLLILGAIRTGRADPLQQRLSQISAQPGQTLEQFELQKPFFDRAVRPFVARVAGLAQRLSSRQNTVRTEERLARAGNPGAMRALDFVGLKVLMAGLLGLFAFLLFFVLGGNPLIGLVMTLALGALGYIGPDFWLSSRISGRQHRILRALPDTIDLLTISVRAGLGFDSALAKVVEKSTGPLADEFRRALTEIRLGKARRDALRDTVTRTDVAPLSSFIAAIIQAEQLGVSMAKVLQVQSEQLRIERRQRAEEMAAKAPIKMLFPLVGCIFPAMFIVILGPAFIQIIQVFGSTPQIH
jgi:tight adherence protein C